jgi:signal transduction histidine kinase
LATERGRLDALATVLAEDLEGRLDEARGYLDIAKASRSREAYAEVARAHDRMGRLVDDLRLLAEDGPAPADFETVHLRAVANRAWRAVETGDATMEVVGTDVLAAPDRLAGLLERLVENAVEHGGDGPTVRVGPLGNGGFLVEDTGPGIPADDRDRVFEPGYTTASDAVGLGLSVVERVANAHGLTVDLTDAAAGGARFEFRPDGTVERSDGETVGGN